LLHFAPDRSTRILGAYTGGVNRKLWQELELRLTFAVSQSKQRAKFTHVTIGGPVCPRRPSWYVRLRSRLSREARNITSASWSGRCGHTDIPPRSSRCPSSGIQKKKSSRTRRPGVYSTCRRVTAERSTC